MYARALFEAARDEDRLEPVREELGDFVEAQRQVPELRGLLLNPQIDHHAKTAALEELLGGDEKLVRNFLLLLAEKNRAGRSRKLRTSFSSPPSSSSRRSEEHTSEVQSHVNLVCRLLLEKK